MPVAESVANGIFLAYFFISLDKVSTLDVVTHILISFWTFGDGILNLTIPHTHHNTPFHVRGSLS